MMNMRRNTNSDRYAIGTADAARGILITAVIGFISYFVMVPKPENAQAQPFMSSTGIYLLLIGVGLQVLILFGKPLIGKYERAHGLEGQISPIAVHILQLLADGATVLLFAIAVFGNVSRFASDI